MSVPEQRTPRSCRSNASATIPISKRYSVALLHDARPPPPAAAARVARARHDRRGRRRAPVHAVRRLAAARDARTRDRRAAARARRPRRAPHRRRARARRARRRAARARGARRGRPRRGRRHGRRPRPHRRVPVGRAAPRDPGDGVAARATPRGFAASSSRPSPSRRCRRWRSATSISCSATSGSTSRGGCPRACSATSCCATPCASCCRRRTRRRAAIAPRCRSPSSPARPGRPATRDGLGRDDQRTCRELGGFEPDVRHRTNDAAVSLALVARGLAVTMLPDLVLPRAPPGRRACARIADGPVERAIFAVTRAADAARPSTRALLDAVGAVAARLG